MNLEWLGRWVQFPRDGSEIGRVTAVEPDGKLRIWASQIYIVPKEEIIEWR